MYGQAVLLFTMANIPKLIDDLLEKSNLSVKEIDFFLFHQASNVVLDNIQRILKIPTNKLPRNSQSYGNTTSSTIPILMKDLIRITSSIHLNYKCYIKNCQMIWMFKDSCVRRVCCVLIEVCIGWVNSLEVTPMGL